MTSSKRLKRIRRAKGVFLKGDIPILVGSESAEVWHHPSYFDTHFAAGAPPDMYYSEGQYWGFPLFRWDELRKDHYYLVEAAFKIRLPIFSICSASTTSSVFFVSGPSRSMLIPKKGITSLKKKMNGKSQGRELLHMIISYSEGMMPIAEDLGTIPAILPICLNEMGICGTKIMRWERDWKNEDQQQAPYIPFNEYPPASMTSVSTHDSPTLTQWWRDYPEEAESFALFKQWKYIPELSPSQRLEILWDSHHTSSLFHINLLQEYFALFPELVWPDPDDERINIPGLVLPTNWTYRYRLFVEEITSHHGLEETMQKILFSSTPPIWICPCTICIYTEMT